MNTKIWHPYTKFSALEAGLPLITRGDGIYLYDAQGTAYVDAISSWWCANLGHSHPKIVEAIQKQSAELQHSILGNLSHPRAIELSERLAGLMPTPDRHVLYASDGASANEAAIKVAVQYFHNIGQPERSGFVSLTNPYHGDTIGTVSVGYMESFHKPIQPLLFPCTFIDIPTSTAGSSSEAKSTSSASCPNRGTFPYQVFRPALRSLGEGGNMEEPDQEAFDQAAAIIREKGPGLAAVMVESLCQGASGMRMYSAEFLKHIANVCEEVGCLLIVDEIAMGCGRTGKMWAFEHAGIDPDIVTVGKGITAGTLPLSATIVKDSIHETFNDHDVDRTFYHGHTFAGNPIAAAAPLGARGV